MDASIFSFGVQLSDAALTLNGPNFHPYLEIIMDTTEISSRSAVAIPAPTTDMKLEVVVIPVADVDRAKSFYVRLG